MADTSMALVPIQDTGVDTYRASTNAATLCGEIVKATAMSIQGRKYVRVEGWQAIAIAHGCVVSARDVERIEGGLRAIGEVRRMADGNLIATAEGFLGDDEPMWQKRPMFARRAMVQTRAMSRACRTAFAHVVVMIDKSLGTTPAEEMEYLNERDPDGPGSSWGAGGKQQAVADAERDGLTANAPAKRGAEIARDAEKVAKTRAKVDDAIATFRLSGQTAETLKAFWASNGRAFDWISDHMPEEFARLEAAYNEALDAARDRAA